MILQTEDIAEIFIKKYKNKEFTIINGEKMLEIINTSFHANSNRIFGEPNSDYINREIEWYNSQSLNVDYIPGKTPLIWRNVSSHSNIINSNYGYLIFSDKNHSQYDNVMNGLLKNPSSRQAVMIYTRPSMHKDAFLNGMKDFICTNTVSYFIRNSKLVVCVYMRSNDVVFGYRNDYAWQKHVQDRFVKEYNEKSDSLKIEAGEIYWNVASLHVYPRHFNLVKNHQLEFKYGIN
jgi:thymidylate synthase